MKAHYKMLTALLLSHKQLVTKIAQAIGPCSEENLQPLLSGMQHRTLDEKEVLFSAGVPNGKEYFLLNGVLRTFVLSPEGEEVTLSFFVAPCVVSPSIAREWEGASQCSCDALTNSATVEFENHALMEQMISNPAVQIWGDAVMREDLLKRTRREIGLATKTSKQRLEEFREQYPALEDKISHHMIASYLGVTPVTLSRIRNAG